MRCNANAIAKYVNVRNNPKVLKPTFAHLIRLRGASACHPVMLTTPDRLHQPYVCNDGDVCSVAAPPVSRVPSLHDSMPPSVAPLDISEMEPIDSTGPATSAASASAGITEPQRSTTELLHAVSKAPKPQSP